MNLVYSLYDAAELCADLKPVLGLVGWVILGVKIAVPIILIVMGMIDMAKAVTEKSEDEIKKAQSKLVKKAVAAVAVFLVATLVTLLMNLIGANDWKDAGCNKCLNSPWDCPVVSDSNNSETAD